MKETDKSVDTGAKFPYLDILYLEHPEPKNHKRMSREARAGQFSPFAALTGYDEQVKETARLTSKKIDLDDEEKEQLSNKLIFKDKTKINIEDIVNINIDNLEKTYF